MQRSFCGKLRTLEITQVRLPTIAYQKTLKSTFTSWWPSHPEQCRCFQCQCCGRYSNYSPSSRKYRLKTLQRHAMQYGTVITTVQVMIGISSRLGSVVVIIPPAGNSVTCHQSKIEIKYAAVGSTAIDLIWGIWRSLGAGTSGVAFCWHDCREVDVEAERYWKVRLLSISWLL